MRAALLALALASVAYAAPATQAPPAGWTLDRVRAALTRVDKLPAPAAGVLVLPVTAGGTVAADGGAISLLAMLAATNVPRQVLAPAATRYLRYLHTHGYFLPGRIPARSVKELLGELRLETVARAEASDAGPEPELTLSFDGPQGAKVYKQRAKRAALVPWIALRIHEYLGTALSPEERAALEKLEIPEAELPRLTEALHARVLPDSDRQGALAAKLDADFPARPECWLVHAKSVEDLAPVLAEGRRRFPGHPYVSLLEWGDALARQDWNATLTLGFRQLEQDWRDPQTVASLLHAAEELPIAGAGEAVLQSWKRREPKSARPHLVENETALAFAWDLRGTDVANKVDKSAWTRIHDHVNRAVAAAQKAHELSPRDIEPVLAMMRAQVLSGDRAAMPYWFERGRAIDPANLELYTQRLHLLLPQWYGSELEMLAFCRDVVAKAPPEGGAPLATYGAFKALAGNWVREREQAASWMFFAQRPDAWSLCQPAFERVIESQAPFSVRVFALNQYARLASWVNKREVVRKLIPLIGENWRLDVFDSMEAVAKIRAWAAEEPPKPVAGGKAEYKRLGYTGLPAMLKIQKIPARPGASFGFSYEVTASGAPVRLRIELHHPPMRMPSGEQVAVEPPKEFTVQPGKPIRDMLGWNFQAGYEYEFVPGTWSWKVFANDREIASEDFEIVR